MDPTYQVIHHLLKYSYAVCVWGGGSLLSHREPLIDMLTFISIQVRSIGIHDNMITTSRIIPPKKMLKKIEGKSKKDPEMFCSSFWMSCILVNDVHFFEWYESYWNWVWYLMLNVIWDEYLFYNYSLQISVQIFVDVNSCLLIQYMQLQVDQMGNTY